MKQAKFEKLRDGPFNIQGGEGVWDILKKIVGFPTGAKKNKMSSMKLKKKFVLHSMNFFEALFPGSYKGLQITQKLSCM